MKIYIGCALHQAPYSFIASVSKFKNTFRDEYEVLDFVGTKAGTSKQVYEWDTKCVKECDLFIAICDYPSLGLGYELGVALSEDKKVIALAKEGLKISRLVEGINHPNYKLLKYESLDGASKKLLKSFSEGSEDLEE